MVLLFGLVRARNEMTVYLRREKGLSKISRKCWSRQVSVIVTERKTRLCAFHLAADSTAALTWYRRMGIQVFTNDLNLAKPTEIAKSAYYCDILGPATLTETRLVDSISSWTELSSGSHGDPGRTALL